MKISLQFLSGRINRVGKKVLTWYNDFAFHGSNRISICWMSKWVRKTEEATELVGPFRSMPQEPWHPGKGAKPDCIIQLNCREVRTHASCKTTRTWENFNHRGTKMILLSDELWSIANNSKSFANGSKSIINNLGLYKRSDIYLI